MKNCFGLPILGKDETIYDYYNKLKASEIMIFEGIVLRVLLGDKGVLKTLENTVGRENENRKEH